MDTFPYLGSLITEDGECTTEFRTRINRGQAIEASLQKIRKSHNIPISTKIRPKKALVWPVATYGCESWTLRKNEETRLDAFKMKGLRRILLVSRTAKKTNEWVLNKAGVKRELLDTVKARKLAYYGHTMRKQRSCLEKEIMQGTMHEGEKGHARPGWTTSRTSRRGQDSPWKSPPEWQITEINGESTSMVWPTLGSRKAKQKNSRVTWFGAYAQWPRTHFQW